MKHLYRKIISAVALLSLCSAAQAQDPEFTQFYANPMYLNPALAGNKICPRFNISYRTQWPGIYGTYTTLGASFDRLVHQIKGGVGLMVMHDRAAQGTLNTTGIGAVYAPVVPLTRNSSISFGIQAGYWQKAVNWSKLTFGDMIDPQRGFINATNETPVLSKRGNFDLAAGTVLNTSHFFIGAAVHHILEPNESLLGTESKLPRKYTVHAGGNIPVGNRHESETVVSPNIMYRQQGNFRQLNLGVYIKKDALVGGLWYRGNDAFIMLLGIETGGLKIGYSYDVTVSRLTNASAGSHELTLGYQLSCKPPSKKYRPGICPSW